MFVKRMHAAKVNAEKKMRRDLDIKISQLPYSRLLQTLGKETSEKVRFYSRLYRQHSNTSISELAIKMSAE